MSTHKGLPTFKQEKKQVATVLKQLPDVVGQTAVDHAYDNFDREGFKDGGKVDKWASRKDQSARSQGRQILVKEGHLKASIDYEVTGQDIGIYADAESDGFKYGSVHNEGGPNHPQRKFADNSKDIEDEIEKHLDREMDRIFS